MFRARISLSLAALNLELRQAIETLAKWGVPGVQVDLRTELTADRFGETARRQFFHLLNERNLTLASGHFPLRNPIAAPEHLGLRLEALKSAIQFAGKLKIRRLTLRAGRIPSEEDVEGISNVHSVLSELAGAGNHHGVILCLIPCGETATELRQFIQSIQTGPVLVDADLGAWVLNRQSVPAQLRELHDLIGHVEIRDAIRDADGQGREVPVGQGEIDWEETVALLSEMGYPGWLNIDRQAGTDRRGDLSRSVDFLKKRLPGGVF